MEKKRRRKIKWGRLLALILIFLLLLGALTGGAIYAYVSLRVDSIKTTSIVIMGLDAKKGGISRNDALMLAVINPQTKEMELLSIPRDTYLKIPCLDNKKDKITHAYVFGGRACTMGALEDNFELPELKNYVAVDFDQMIGLIDLIDGVDLLPSKSFCQKGTDKQNYCFTKGESIHLTGQMALAYSRQRKIDSDVYRGERQQEIIHAIIEKAKLLSIRELYPLANQALKLSETNLDIVQLAAVYKTVKSPGFVLNTNKLKGKDAYYYSPGTKQTQYMYEVDNKWLEIYLTKLKELMK